MQQNFAKRPYNHCRYAGNLGDVWKHVLLLEAVHGTLEINPGAFHFVETHGGPGYARLGIGGDWRYGIGRFMGEDSLAVPSHPYFDLSLPGMQKNCLYKGSWVLVMEYLRSLGVNNASAKVHEVNADALKMAKSAVRGSALENCVQVLPKCGYEALTSIEHADLVLIDPPYRSSDGTADDWESVGRAVDVCKAKGWRFLVWYPIFGRRDCDALIARSPRASFELVWKNNAPSHVMAGCGVVADPITFNVLKRQEGILQTLATVTKSQYTVVMSGACQLRAVNFSQQTSTTISAQGL